MNTRRIKVVFDREIRQRKKDARPSFALLDRVQYPRISDFCERLIHLFDLSGVCPHGITLSINGDLILPSETSHILRETDIVRVGMTKESLPGIVPEAKIEHDLIEVKEESYEGQERV
ncbi:unnamed protein product [Arabidopsis halleri]